MRLNHLPGAVHLGYCTNIHAGTSWPEIRASLDEYVPGIKAAVAADRPFGIGLRLSGVAARALGEPAALRAFQAQLDRLGAYVFTINAFPYGPFHGVPVKQDVYLPDWRDAERVAFTGQCADILAQLLPDGVSGSISTVPGAFKAACAAPLAAGAMARGIAAAVAGLVDIERRSGRTIALALEPEPCCFLETVDETLAFFAEHLFAGTGLAQLADSCRLSAAQARTAMQRHLGVCYDVCHGAVEFEDPVTALERLRAAGIGVPKIQLSCALRVARMDHALIPALERFDDGVYLHQVVACGPALRRYADLPEAIAAFRAGTADGEWRVHCHVPLFLEQLGVFGATQPELRRTLQALRAHALSDHLEVETYTWDVLPAEYRGASKVTAIARELTYVLEQLK